MSDNKKEEIVVLNSYHFFRSTRRITVKSKENKDEKELETIANLYQEYYEKRKRGRKLTGKWRWCFNPDCNSAVYVPRYEVEKSHYHIFCSHRCAAKFFGIQTKHFRDFTDFKAAAWIVDTATKRELDRVIFLNILIESEGEKVKKALEEIYKPNYPTAQTIIEEFLETKEGEKLKNLIEQSPDLIKARALYFLILTGSHPVIISKIKSFTSL